LATVEGESNVDGEHASQRNVKTKHRETLTLESDEPINVQVLIRLAQDLQGQGVRVLVPSGTTYTLEECQRMIIEKGSSHILSIERLEEAVLPPTSTRDDRSLLVRVLREQVEALSPSRDLVIIDPYFLPTKLPDRADYLNVFREVFARVITKITHIRFITKPGSDPDLYKSIEQEITALNPQVQVSHRTTDSFHDRMWIADATKGLFVGTSLNGIGKKYALTDFMRNDDTEAVVVELQRQGLI
jgi:hypothetical protein